MGWCWLWLKRSRYSGKAHCHNQAIVESSTLHDTAEATCLVIQHPRQDQHRHTFTAWMVFFSAFSLLSTALFRAVISLVALAWSTRTACGGAGRAVKPGKNMSLWDGVSNNTHTARGTRHTLNCVSSSSWNETILLMMVSWTTFILFSRR